MLFKLIWFHLCRYQTVENKVEQVAKAVTEAPL